MMNRSETEHVSAGHLYVVSTPIGNLADLSERARCVLSQVDRVAAEDTRTSKKLLAAYGVSTPCFALHEHNENALADALVKALQDGESLALISDAGTPMLSDPGFVLVRAARAAGVPVVAVPGASALLAALAISGLPTDRFSFEGFPPAKSGARQRWLQERAAEVRTQVFYESPHRLADSLTDMEAAFGSDRPACLARELTKRFEESHTASLGELRHWLAAKPERSRGEFVIVVGGASADQGAGEAGAQAVLDALLEVLEPSAAARTAARITGLPRNRLYKMALEQRKDG